MIKNKIFGTCNCFKAAKSSHVMSCSITEQSKKIFLCDETLENEIKIFLCEASLSKMPDLDHDGS